MFDMFLDSATLFLKGKLFQDYKSVFMKILIGALATAVICVVLAKLGVGLAFSVGIAAIVGGALQPYLFKNLKYK